MLDGCCSEIILLTVKMFATETGKISINIPVFNQFDNVAWICSYRVGFHNVWFAGIYEMECKSITWIHSKVGLNRVFDF